MPTNLYGINDNFDLETSHVLPALLRKIYLAKLWQEEKYEQITTNTQTNSWEEAQTFLARFGIGKDKVEIWGSGRPRREFLFSDDLANACVFLLENVDFKDLSKDTTEIRNTHINIGTGEDISIGELARLICQIVGFDGELFFNTNKPDGTMVKRTNMSKIGQLGWEHETTLERGIKQVIDWYWKIL